MTTCPSIFVCTYLLDSVWIWLPLPCSVLTRALFIISRDQWQMVSMQTVPLCVWVWGFQRLHAGMWPDSRTLMNKQPSAQHLLKRWVQVPGCHWCDRQPSVHLREKRIGDWEWEGEKGGGGDKRKIICMDAIGRQYQMPLRKYTKKSNGIGLDMHLSK